MRHYLPHLILLFILWANESLATSVIQIVADDWCPYTCPPNSDKPGFIVEATMQSFAAVGVKTHYQITGWRRALRNVSVGKMNVLLGADASMSDELYLDDVFVIRDETIFLTKKNRKIIFNKSIDFSSYSIGTISDYTYTDSEVWAEAIENHPKQVRLSSSAGERRLIELLLMGRFDIALVNLDVSEMVLNEIDARDQVVVHRPGMVSELFLGFTKNEKGLALREKFQRGFNAILKNGELKKIYQRYQVDYPY